MAGDLSCSMPALETQSRPEITSIKHNIRKHARGSKRGHRLPRIWRIEIHAAMVITYCRRQSSFPLDCPADNQPSSNCADSRFPFIESRNSQLAKHRRSQSTDWFLMNLRMFKYRGQSFSPATTNNHNREFLHGRYLPRMSDHKRLGSSSEPERDVGSHLDRSKR